MRVIVIGAGIAGSSAAYRLRQLGHRTTVLERKGRVGGRAVTYRQEGFSVDVGADVILSFYERTLALLREMGRDRELVEMDSSSGLLAGQRMHVMRPGSPMGALSHPALKAGDKLRLAYTGAHALLAPRIDLFDLDALAAADDGETAAEWARRMVGERAYQHLLRPGIETRWYYSCEEAAAPLAKALARLAPRTRFYCLGPGMGSLTEWLNEGGEVQAEAEVSKVETEGEAIVVHLLDGRRLEADAAIVATDAGRAAGLIPDGPSRETLASVRFAHNVRVMLGYERSAWSGSPVRAVFSSGPGDHLVAGVTLVSGKSPGWVPSGADVAEVHFSGWATDRLDDEEAIGEAKRAIAQYLGPAIGEPVFELAHRCDPGLPIPVPGQYRRLAQARDRMPTRIRLAGDYMSHATIEGAVTSGESAARELDAL